MPQVTNPVARRRVALIGLGANLSETFEARVRLILAVIGTISDDLGAVAEKSRLYQTPAFPAESGPDFVNAVIRIETRLSASELLKYLHGLEAAHGRTRAVRWGARTLDLDLLALDDLVLPDRSTWSTWHKLSLADQSKKAPERLILPHPRLQDRGFVLVPLCDVAPDWRHPVLGQTAHDLCAALSKADRDQIVPVT